MFGARGQDGQVVEGPFQGRGWASRSHLRGFVPSILNKLCRVLVFVVGDSLQGSQRVSRIMHSSRLRLTWSLPGAPGQWPADGDIPIAVRPATGLH